MSLSFFIPLMVINDKNIGNSLGSFRVHNFLAVFLS